MFFNQMYASFDTLPPEQSGKSNISNISNNLSNKKAVM